MGGGGSILDQTPATECVLEHELENIGTAFFYVLFPSPGRYYIDIYQNGVCTDTIPFDVIDRV